MIISSWCIICPSIVFSCKELIFFSELAIILSILLAVLLFTNSGTLGKQLNEVLGGMMGIIRYVLPIGAFAIALKMASDDYGEEYITN